MLPASLTPRTYLLKCARESELCKIHTYTPQRSESVSDTHFTLCTMGDEPRPCQMYAESVPACKLGCTREGGGSNGPRCICEVRRRTHPTPVGHAYALSEWHHQPATPQRSPAGGERDDGCTATFLLFDCSSCLPAHQPPQRTTATILLVPLLRVPWPARPVVTSHPLASGTSDRPPQDSLPIPSPLLYKMPSPPKPWERAGSSGDTVASAPATSATASTSAAPALPDRPSTLGAGTSTVAGANPATSTALSAPGEYCPGSD